MKEHNTCSGCLGDSPANEDRRKLFRLAAGGLAGLAIAGRAAAQGESARVLPGDLLVEENAEGELAPLKLSDLKPGKPIMAFPYDPAKKMARTETRMNKVILLRLAESDLDPAMKAVSAGGVVAFSGVCTHHGCDVKTWMAKDQALACFCHGSKFSPFKAGAVVGGPAPRSLPLLPIALKGDKLVVTAPFTTPPGASVG